MIYVYEIIKKKVPSMFGVKAAQDFGGNLQSMTEVEETNTDVEKANVTSFTSLNRNHDQQCLYQ